MASTSTAADLIPERTTIARLREAAAGCRACPLWKSGTQTVFGKGRRSASLMLVGEQPGDREDRAGEPFVGPAGKVLDEALKAAGIARGETYVTNAVKHFKWRPAGKRRLHQTPRASEIEACRPWIEAELEAVKPRGLVCLGATAAKALLGSKVRVTRDRGTLLESELAQVVTVTVHPSAILRIRDEPERHEAREGLAADLAFAARELDRLDESRSTGSARG
jgi:uracil-DNA glycosylase family protein